jgi:hypothetical protein
MWPTEPIFKINGLKNVFKNEFSMADLDIEAILY